MIFRERRLEWAKNDLDSAEADLIHHKRFQRSFGGYRAQIKRAERRINRLEAKIKKLEA